MKLGILSQSRLAVVAIPAQNEASDIAGCLAALAMQRDEAGAPIARGSLEILVFANSCTDDTAAVARQAARSIPHPVVVAEEDMPAARRNAGWARKRAMDLAAIRLAEVAPLHGLILTTDADSRVSPTWFAATLRAFDKGVDCVAGYIDAIPAEYVALGDRFLARGRLEDTYLRYIAEIDARCDPRPHDPWPTHRVSSGASLAVTAAAYAAIGGLPPRPVGEDAALTVALERAGLKVRHAMDVSVATSCRFDGRASGGAADTMRHRHGHPDAPCDDDLEPALQATRRALCKGILRERWSRGPSAGRRSAGLGTSREIIRTFDRLATRTFEDAWEAVCDLSPALKRGTPLRPSDLPRQIAIARMIVRHLRPSVTQPKSVPGDRSHHEGSRERAVPV
ncbi:glycosyltransferase [Bradyrhizobium oligotrophicum]|uniref:glycosyltransferase n=1 Tax=Bradyrhizobium oligotrophicum TaxID=44255 RepID=UPI003EBA1686